MNPDSAILLVIAEQKSATETYKAEVTRLAGENERLRAENAAILEQLALARADLEQCRSMDPEPAPAPTPVKPVGYQAQEDSPSAAHFSEQ